MPEMPNSTPPGLRWMRTGGAVLALGVVASIVAFLPAAGLWSAQPILWVLATGLTTLGLGLLVAGIARAASARRRGVPRG